ncbi:hypothetical protein E0H73_34970 [Kribbella pittospori]|uniref:Uncharacterized protein n=1 Tax=Kribbella pittospori TaxID=722689 RepID=A0A4V2M9M1_9ACTN|nr:hypothetical protein [Kribbella pittospori]TCC55922.1 hypothetical protein E0H73_34970 [Kribbella pittospori]
MTEQGNNSGEEPGRAGRVDGPGPYQGVFGSADGLPGPPPGSTPYGDRPGSYGDRPGAYGGVFGAGPAAYAPVAPPKQVTIAAVISLGLGVMSILLAGLALTSAGEQISEVLTGTKDAQGVAVAAAVICAFIYILPAIFVRKRRAWARIMLIVVAAIGIVGGLVALPSGILGLAIHGTLLFLMLQQPTKLWFHHR